MSRHPTVKWAQRCDKIYLTVELPDAKDVNLKLEPEGKFSFSANKDGVSYEVDLELFDKVSTKESKFIIGMRSIVYVIKKAEKKWWSRLLKDEGKPPAFLKVDWDKWIDEEDENEKAKDGKDFSVCSKLMIFCNFQEIFSYKIIEVMNNMHPSSKTKKKREEKKRE
ncbi:co-chaperone protein p23-1 isoform X1 [Phoenix dactylifera]|uniref:Co-chaperone protein p23 n=1 Tax=Phoenix dactylifera TaxID=42345 RepID=A0A8B9A287_PHODC|nr:co-chaperone protein p23-1 isoform X1 [Phoenix dactylifera]